MSILGKIFRKEYATDEELEQYLDTNRIGRPEKVFKNQDSKIGPGFSKEFYDELHRFYSQGNRRSGRTYLLARVLVNTAIETGKPIYILDHHSIFKNTRETEKHLIDEIFKTIREYESKGLLLSCNFICNDKFTLGFRGNIYEATRVYNMIKNDYTPYNSGVNEYPLIPDETFENNKKLLLI